MEFPCVESNIWSRRRRQNLTLEKYLDVTESTRKQSDLTISQLNQIIGMHGFKKLFRIQKKVLIDVVNSINLMDLTRSTLADDHVSSCAFITSEEAIKDLFNLNWQECCVTSFKTLNSVNYDLTSLQNENANAASASKLKSRKKVPRIGGADEYSKVSNEVSTLKKLKSMSKPGNAAGGTESACTLAVVEWCGAKGKSCDGGDSATGG